MRDTCYLVLNKNGVVKMTKNPPSLKSDEIKFKLNVLVPNTIFERPILESKLEVPINTGLDGRIQQFEFELKELKKDI